MEINKHYNEAFKKYAVKLTYKRKNIMSVARELQIPYGHLYNWRKEYVGKIEFCPQNTRKDYCSIE